MSQDFLFESRYDGITRVLVRDIIDVFKKNKTGEFDLPEYFGRDEMVYEFGSHLGAFSVSLDLNQDENVKDYIVDGDFIRDFDTIEIRITSNPDFQDSYLYNLIGDLNELVRHELEHMKQKYAGFKFPYYVPKTQYGHYSRPYEIEAQLAGFKRLAKLQNKNIEDVMEKWFQKYQDKHELTPKQIKNIVQKILSKNTN